MKRIFFQSHSKCQSYMRKQFIAMSASFFSLSWHLHLCLLQVLQPYLCLPSYSVTFFCHWNMDKINLDPWPREKAIDSCFALSTHKLQGHARLFCSRLHMSIVHEKQQKAIKYRVAQWFYQFRFNWIFGSIWMERYLLDLDRTYFVTLRNFFVCWNIFQNVPITTKIKPLLGRPLSLFRGRNIKSYIYLLGLISIFHSLSWNYKLLQFRIWYTFFKVHG